MKRTQNFGSNLPSNCTPGTCRCFESFLLFSGSHIFLKSKMTARMAVFCTLVIPFDKLASARNSICFDRYLSN